MTISSDLARYEELLRQLNEHVKAFNKFLSSDCLIDEFSTKDSVCCKITDTLEDDIRFPLGSKDTPGVYVLCGSSVQDKEKLIVYVGKASSQNIGHRLYVHMKRTEYGNEERTTYVYGNFYIDYIFTIPIPQCPWMATALEEYIITQGFSNNIQMCNTIGNK